jgi:hypothetical protein
MQMQFNPANTNLARDFANYKKTFEENDDAKKEIKEHLEKNVKVKVPDPADPAKQIEVSKYPPGTPDHVYTAFPAYQDFAFGGGSNGDRLGGSLGLRPGRLDTLEQPNPGQFQFARGHGNPPPVPPTGTVTVRGDGAILHNPVDVPKKEDREASDHYMHHVFDDILYESRDLLEAINLRLGNYTASPTKANRDFYAGAVMNFDDFRASLKTRNDHNYSQAFNWVTIEPVVTNEGYIVSARIEVNWKNPYHSSSTIRVP